MDVCISLRAAGWVNYGCSACLLSCFPFWMGLTTITIVVSRHHWELTTFLRCLRRNGLSEFIFKSSFISVSIWCKGGFWPHTDFVFKCAFILNQIQQHRSWKSPFARLNRLTVDWISWSLAISKLFESRRKHLISLIGITFSFHFGLALSAAALHTPLTLFNNLCICDGYLSSCAPGWRMKL